MQLILDADDIDIKRNMSTIEQESLNEKFLANKIIENLPDDITSGNKENIQKQDNIIPDPREDEVPDTDKEITTSDAIQTNNLNEVDKDDTENVKNIKEVVSANVTNSEIDPKITHDDLVIENKTEESQAEENKENFKNVPSVDIVQEVEEEVGSNTVSTNDKYSTQSNNNVITKDKEENPVDIIDDAAVNVTTDKIGEKPVEATEDNAKEEPIESKKNIQVDEKHLVNVPHEEIDLKKEVVQANHPVESITVEQKENQVDLVVDDLAVDIEIEKKEEKQIHVNNDNIQIEEKGEKQVEVHVDDATKVTALLEEENQVVVVEGDNVEVKNEAERNQESIVDVAITDDEKKSTRPNDIPSLELDDKSTKMECSPIEPPQSDNLNENNTTIEIDDEDEKYSDKNLSDAGVEVINANMEVEESYENIEIQDDENMEVQATEEGAKAQELDKNIEVGQSDGNKQDKINSIPLKSPIKEVVEPKRICKLSNNLDIFSDEEDDLPDVKSPKNDIPPTSEKQCINIDDDDDIMLIDEDTKTKDNKKEDPSIDNNTKTISDNIESVQKSIETYDNVCTETTQVAETIEKIPIDSLSPKEADTSEITETENKVASDIPKTETSEIPIDKVENKKEIKKPLLPKHFIKTCKKNLVDMSREDLEDFCILKIVESIVDRSNLGEIKSQLKNLTQTVEECKKKCLMLSKQNKDLQVVLKSVQEEQKCGPDVHVTPLKITRSVGMQVVMMVDKTTNGRKKTVNGVGSPIPIVGSNTNTKQPKSTANQNARNIKEKASNNQPIPVPRLVPAAAAAKTNQTVANNIVAKHNNVSNPNILPNGVRNSPPAQKMPEKRPRSQAVTVDLTDDEPPPKLPTMQRGGVNQAMRVAGTPPNILPAQRFAANLNNPRKVYIPISGAQAQNVRPGQTIMLKTVPTIGPRQRCPTPQVAKVQQNAGQVRLGRLQPTRHPAPLPDAMKQYQPPNWKALPPAPDLKLSKVENGIVISWRIDGYQEENHEEIASYQLYAYQETTAPPSTTLWKKIGDVKALPLPMACTLTQFMAGYKYYFAVRAVDIRTRFGPFSSPGSILLLNKM